MGTSTGSYPLGGCALNPSAAQAMTSSLLSIAPAERSRSKASLPSCIRAVFTV
jgi:hypothetical protein